MDDTPTPSTPASDEGKVITFFSTKGGVGKTTIAANTAIALARMGKRVAILDCDLQFGDMAIFFDLYPNKTIANLVEEPSIEVAPQLTGEEPLEAPEPDKHSPKAAARAALKMLAQAGSSSATRALAELDGEDAPRWSVNWTSEIVKPYLHHHVSGVDLLLAPSRPEYAEIVQVEHIEEVLRVLRETYDYILVDTVGMFRNIELSILDLSDRVIVPVTISLPATKSVKLCLDLLGNLNYSGDKVTVIVNHVRASGCGLTVEDVSLGLSPALSKLGSVTVERFNKDPKQDLDALIEKTDRKAWAAAPQQLRPIAVEIPFTPDALGLAENRGKPFLLDPSSAATPLGQAYTALARLIAGVSISPPIPIAPTGTSATLARIKKMLGGGEGD